MIHQGGYYLHYKNKLYRAVGVAKHSETLEEMVVYEPQYGEGGLMGAPFGHVSGKCYRRRERSA